mmetsp:Transcript_102595/g.319722  ORF Transcript_102595/g.319722 Transcript_102595/m.319722 type:complete len:217 (-) Transcript_102595:506-1156(-)
MDGLANRAEGRPSSALPYALVTWTCNDGTSSKWARMYSIGTSGLIRPEHLSGAACTWLLQAAHSLQGSPQGPLTPKVLANRSAGRGVVPMTALGDAGLLVLLALGMVQSGRVDAIVANGAHRCIAPAEVLGGLELNCEAGLSSAGPGEPSALSYKRLHAVSRPDCPLDPARPKLPFGQDAAALELEASLCIPSRRPDLVGVVALGLPAGDRGRSPR